ncbi:hypothetical protein [Sphingomonas humi]|uniref:Uncharacterized protein n=1 Tax=Sphingomonas humi TaxID=335630 RepID=A0ABP7RWD4_9SPHN
MLSRLMPEERLALLLGAIYIFLNLIWKELYDRYWIFAAIPHLIFWIVVLAFAIDRAASARHKDHLPPQRRRAAVAIPLVLGSLWFVETFVGVTPRLLAASSLALRSEEMADAQSKAGPGRAASIPYLEGIPDGGVKIIRYAEGNPKDLSQAEQLRLTGERIHGCKRIGRQDWLCGYD